MPLLTGYTGSAGDALLVCCVWCVQCLVPCPARCPNIMCRFLNAWDAACLALDDATGFIASPWQ